MIDETILKNNKVRGLMGFPGGSVGKESTWNTRDTGDSGSIPELGRPLGGEHDHPLQYSCLEDPMYSGAW